MKQSHPLAVKFVLTHCFFLLFLNAGAQNDFRNSIYAELGGNAWNYSVNYERIFSKQVPVKVGISLLPRNIGITMMAGKYFGSQAHHFELLGGISYAQEHDKIGEVSTYYHCLYATAFIGYRYQKPNRRFLFRAGYTPYFSEKSGHRAGISAGYRF